jgi:hypothetical protein
MNEQQNSASLSREETHQVEAFQLIRPQILDKTLKILYPQHTYSQPMKLSSCQHQALLKITG